MSEEGDSEDDVDDPSEGDVFPQQQLIDPESDEDLSDSLSSSSNSAESSKVIEINFDSFEELVLPSEFSSECQASWEHFISGSTSRVAAGEAVFGAVHASVPSLQYLFKMPLAVMAMRFMTALNNIVTSMHTAKSLRITVETLAFQHLAVPVTSATIMTFREALIDMLELKLGTNLTTNARDGWISILNYVGGAFIYVRATFAERMKVLEANWAAIMRREEESGEIDVNDKQNIVQEIVLSGTGKGSAPSNEMRSSEKKGFAASHIVQIPRTFKDMFVVNAAVMGFAGKVWMLEVLESFDTIVENVSNSRRLREECDILALRIARHAGEVKLSEFQSVMMSTLRSLLPADWSSQSEVAWTWLWENVAEMIEALMGKQSMKGKVLEDFLGSLAEDQVSFLRTEMYQRFFAIAPSGEAFFKQSTTRQHFIANRILQMVCELYRDPREMVDNISAVGLRHVGYGSPPEFFSPFVDAAVQAVDSLTDDSVAVESFSWSLSLISRILVRAIEEGSTIVMMAINTNSSKQLIKAVGCAPRGQRAQWVLNIQVGTQSISPLYWALQSGSHASAKAILEDLLTIRADRDRYYYGLDDLFARHPDIVKRLCQDAPNLLPCLLNGMVWRSSVTSNGMRRVNYYVKNLLVDMNGHFADNLEWILDLQDPKLMFEPVLVLCYDLVWNKLVAVHFVVGKCWQLAVISIFMFSQAVLQHQHRGLPWHRYTRFSCRCLIYLCGAGQLLHGQCAAFVLDCRGKNFKWIGRWLAVPKYLLQWQMSVSLLLLCMLIIMLSHEPILYCIGHHEGDFEGSGLFTVECAQGLEVEDRYCIFSSIATMLYWMLLVDLTSMSTWLCAFVLVCVRTIPQLSLYLISLAFLVLVFGTAVATISQEEPDFQGVDVCLLSLWKIALGMFTGEQYSYLPSSTPVFVLVSIFTLFCLVFLANLLVALLANAYQSFHEDMTGFARLKRGRIVVESIHVLPHKRWVAFVEGLQLAQRLEFNEGDIGLAGGIQLLEPSGGKTGRVDGICRYGGPTSDEAPWPAEDEVNEDDSVKSRLEIIEKLLRKALAKHGDEKNSSKEFASILGVESLFAT